MKYVETEDRHRQVAGTFLASKDDPDSRCDLASNENVDQLADLLSGFEDQGWVRVSAARTQLINDLEEIVFGERGSDVLPKRGASALVACVRELREFYVRNRETPRGVP